MIIAVLIAIDTTTGTTDIHKAEFNDHSFHVFKDAFRDEEIMYNQLACTLSCVDLTNGKQKIWRREFEKKNYADIVKLFLLTCTRSQRARIEFN